MLWGNIALRYQTIYMSRILRTYFIEEGNQISLAKSPRARFADGIFYSYSVWINKFIDRLNPAIFYRIRMFAAFCFYAVLAGVNYRDAQTAINKKNRRLIVLLVFPFVYAVFKLSSFFKNKK